MDRKAFVVLSLLAAACVDTPMVELPADSLRVEVPAAPMEWSAVAFEWGFPYLLVGETRYASAVVLDAQGREVPDAPVVIRAADPTRLRVSPNGAVTGLLPGDAELVASHGELETRLLIDVESNVPARLSLSQDFVQIEPGERVRLFATSYNGNGRMLPDSPMWVAEDPGVATVALDGTVQAIAEGDTRVHAVGGEASAVVRVRVVSPSNH